MIQEWNDYRLHLNAEFSTLDDASARDLLLFLKAGEDRYRAFAKVAGATGEEPMADAEEPVPSDDEPVSGVSWDKVKGKWRVVARVGGRQRGFGRFDSLPEANAQARGVRAVYSATGQLPKVGWRVSFGPRSEA